MNKTLHILSLALSILLYPLFIPTYGMALLWLGMNSVAGQLPTVYWIIALVGTSCLTCFVPLSIILMQVLRGQIESIMIDNPGQRTMPYVYTTTCFGFWTYFMHSVLHLPAFMLWVGGGATVALALVTAINLKWKISAHTTAFGGLMGGIISFCLYYGYMLTPAFMTILVLIALLLMYARLYVDAHTPLQVVAGLLLGLLTTLIPNLILFNAQI